MKMGNSNKQFIIWNNHRAARFYTSTYPNPFLLSQESSWNNTISIRPYSIPAETSRNEANDMCYPPEIIWHILVQKGINP